MEECWWCFDNPTALTSAAGTITTDTDIYGLMELKLKEVCQTHSGKAQEHSIDPVLQEGHLLSPFLEEELDNCYYGVYSSMFPKLSG